MQRKETVLKQIIRYLNEKGATKNKKIEHPIYLLRGDDCIGKIESVWLDAINTPVCQVYWWGVSGTMPLTEISTRNLVTLRDYLRDGDVIQ
jgi:hypothetical protein